MESKASEKSAKANSRRSLPSRAARAESRESLAQLLVLQLGVRGLIVRLQLAHGLASAGTISKASRRCVVGDLEIGASGPC